MMKGLCYVDDEKIEIREFPIPEIEKDTDAIVEINYASICTSDIHIIKGKVPRAKKGIILGHEGVGKIHKIGKNVKNYGLSVIIVSLMIRLIAFPVTKKTAMQSELMKKAQPELNRIQKKYENKQDQESLIKQNQEMMAVYKKYNINPMSGCLFAFLQLPIFIAFFEAVQRIPVIFEDKFIGLQLGTTPSVGITSPTFYAYIVLMILIAATTFFSFKMNSTGNMEDPSMKMMPGMMSVMIVFTAIFMPTGLGIYWVTSNLFTIIQNIIVKRSKEVYGKV